MSFDPLPPTKTLAVLAMGSAVLLFCKSTSDCATACSPTLRCAALPAALINVWSGV